MGWASLIALVMKLLLELRRSESAEVFAANMAPTAQAYGWGDGEFLKKLWENREEILEFALRIFDLFAKPSEDELFSMDGEFLTKLWENREEILEFALRDGEFLRKLWENREEILAFVLLLLDRFSETK